MATSLDRPLPKREADFAQMMDNTDPTRPNIRRCRIDIAEFDHIRRMEAPQTPQNQLRREASDFGDARQDVCQERPSRTEISTL